MFFLFFTFASLIVFANCGPNDNINDYVPIQSLKNIEVLESFIDELRLQTDDPINAISREQRGNKLDSDGGYTLKFHTFEQNYSISILPVRSIFSTNFKRFSVLSNSNDLMMKLHEISPPELPGLFFVTADGSGSVYIENTNGQIQVEGVIDDTLRIWKTNNINKALKLPDDYQHNLFGKDEVRSFREKISKKRAQDSSETTESEVPESVTIEVMPILDVLCTEAFAHSKVSVEKYMGIFWNSVARRYTQVESPQVKFTISAVLTLEHDLDWISNAKFSNQTVDGIKFSSGLENWLYSNLGEISEYDVAMLHTSLKMGELDKNKKFSETLLGLASLGGVCHVDDEDEAIFSCGVISDPGGPLYFGILTAAHELAHLLNVDHDGEDKSEKCPAEDGYIMTTLTGGGENSWNFSKCSLKTMKEMLEDIDSSCLRDKPTSAVPIINEFPKTDLDKLCKITNGPNSKLAKEKYQKSICAFLPCTTNSGTVSYGEAAPEGTSCNKRTGICINGRCEKKK